MKPVARHLDVDEPRVTCARCLRRLPIEDVYVLGSIVLCRDWPNCQHEYGERLAARGRSEAQDETARS